MHNSLQHTMRRKRDRAFTFVDLLVVLLIVCLASTVVISGPLTRARETAKRIKCGSNLRQIGQAIMLYANENRGVYPRTIFKVGEAPTQFTGVNNKNPFEGADRPANNDVTAAFFLLARTQDISIEAFICPSTDAVPYTFGGAGHTAQDVSNFSSDQNLSYSYINPYPDERAIKLGYKVNAAVGAETAIAADLNPGKFGDSDVTPATGPKTPNEALSVMRKANSLNHRSEGQSVLFGDGHVEFQQTPFCGVKLDNIYTVAGSGDGTHPTSETISGSPAWAGDSVLLPTATFNPRKKTADQEESEEVAAMQLQIAEQIRKMDTTTPEFRAMKKAIEDKLAEQRGQGAAVSTVNAQAPVASQPSSGTKMLLLGIVIGVGICVVAGGATFAIMRSQARTNQNG